MNAVAKTLTYVAVAFVAVGIAVLEQYRAQPKQIEGSVEIGALFYPDPEFPDRPLFSDPSLAKGLRLAVFDDETEELDEFEIEYARGAWRLANFNGYPTDAQTQLASTLASVSMVRREARQTTRAADHAELGVLDPLDENTYIETGHGQRITIFDENGDDLVDLIVGKRVPDSEPDQHLHFVRRADQNEVYRASVDISVSTKFEDWINDDLLALDPSNDIEEFEPEEEEEPPSDETPEQKVERLAEEARETERRRPAEIVEVETRRSPFVAENVFDDLDFEREGAAGTWTLAGFDPEKETFETTRIDGIVENLGRLKIIGVRSKPENLRADLKLVVNIPNTFRDVWRAVQEDLGSRGFQLELDESGEKFTFLSRYGTLTAGADNGVVYTLYFGDEFSGTESQLQIGGDAEAKSTEETKEGRYLVVRVDFDETLVREPPGKPVEPVKPEPPKKADSNPPNEGEGIDASEADDTADEDADAEDPEAEDAKAEDDPAAQAAYQAALKRYESQMKEYREKLAEWEEFRDELIASGRQRSEVLNDRFGEWYYVITQSDFEDLQVTRDDVVQPKPDDPKPEEPKPDDPKPEEPKVEEPKPEEPKVEEAKSEEPKPEPKSDEPTSDDAADAASTEDEAPSE